MVFAHLLLLLSPESDRSDPHCILGVHQILTLPALGVLGGPCVSCSGNATPLGLPGAQPPPCHSGPCPGRGERDSRERLPEASPPPMPVAPPAWEGTQSLPVPFSPQRRGPSTRQAYLTSGSEGLHGSSFGPRPLPSLSGVTWCHTDSPYWLCPHSLPPPCDLSALLPTLGRPPSQPHPQFWSSQMWQGPRMFAQGISGFRGL